MATHRMSILRKPNPDSSGNVFCEGYTVKATNDAWNHQIVIFNDSGTKIGFYDTFEVPQNYVGAAKFIAVWTSTATSGNVVWQCDYRTVAGDDANSLDQAGTEETPNVTDAAPTAANRRLEAQISPTAANFAAGETVEFFFNRLGTSGSDTMAAAAQLHDLLFEWSDA